MGTSQRQQWPADLARGRKRFLAWRGQRTPGRRIPDALWAMAVGLAKAHGVCRTATALGLDYYSVRKRVEAAAGDLPSNGPAFVELTMPLLAGKQCQFELENGSGATMRVQLAGYDAADLEALARGFWNAM
ncbi:MAG: hypothetical protein ACMG51_10050 [Ginsengibacter sp.]